MRRRLLLTVLAGLLAAGCESGDNPTDSDLSPAVHALAPGYSRIDLQMQDAWGVNDNGMIVGYVKGVGAWWYLGVRRSLPAPQLPWSSYYASNISEDNRISGAQAINGGAKYRALYWKTPTSSPIDLGDLGSGSAQAMDVNSHGILVGVSRAPYASNEWHAFRWENGVMVDINPKGYFASSAMRINDDGVIVGFADMGTPQWHRDAIRWEPNGAINHPAIHHQYPQLRCFRPQRDGRRVGTESVVRSGGVVQRRWSPVLSQCTRRPAGPGLERQVPDGRIPSRSHRRPEGLDLAQGCGDDSAGAADRKCCRRRRQFLWLDRGVVVLREPDDGNPVEAEQLRLSKTKQPQAEESNGK